MGSQEFGSQRESLPGKFGPGKLAGRLSFTILMPEWDTYTRFSELNIHVCPTSPLTQIQSKYLPELFRGQFSATPLQHIKLLPILEKLAVTNSLRDKTIARVAYSWQAARLRQTRRLRNFLKHTHQPTIPNAKEPTLEEDLLPVEFTALAPSSMRFGDRRIALVEPPVTSMPPVPRSRSSCAGPSSAATW